MKVEVCEICQNNLVNFLERQLRCENCGSIYSNKYFIQKTELFFNHDDNINNLLKNIESDMIHYKSKVLPLIDKFFDRHKTVVYDFGGGFPKLTLFLANNIFVLDKFYKEYSSKQSQIESKTISKFIKDRQSKNIRFEYADILVSKSLRMKLMHLLNKINKNEINTILFSFIHILEHFKLDEVLKIFKILSKVSLFSSEFEYYILIYMPNIEKFSNEKQIHAIDAHVLFLKPEKYAEILERDFNYKLKFLQKIDEDFILISKFNNEGAK